jgi:hypothetical protein
MLSSEGDRMHDEGTELRKQVQWAWEIHKDADATLHGRINAFVSVQAFLFASFSLLCTIDHQTQVTGLLIIFIVIAGIASSIAFSFSQQRILAGIEHLKSEYLIPKDNLYAGYFGAKEGLSFDRSKKVRYNIARIAPFVFLGLWVLAILLLTEIRFLVIL